MFLLKPQVLEILAAEFPDQEYDLYSFAHENIPVCNHIWLIPPWKKQPIQNTELQWRAFTFISV